jgi:hypothetical protein
MPYVSIKIAATPCNDDAQNKSDGISSFQVVESSLFMLSSTGVYLKASEVRE